MGIFDFMKKKAVTADNEKEFYFRDAFAENLQFIHKDYYNTEEIQGLFINTENQKCFVMGQVDFPTGKVVVADPLCYLYHEEYSQPLNYMVPIGSYPVHLSVFFTDETGLRIAAARLKITEKEALRYEVAMPEGKSIERLGDPSVLAVFGVDAGLASFCDRKTALDYREFLERWHKGNPECNHYDDYFAAFFAESYVRYPNVQREGGDFIEWEVPDTGNKIAMFATGFGDGIYESLWGFDGDGFICELVIPFINPKIFSE